MVSLWSKLALVLQGFCFDKHRYMFLMMTRLLFSKSCNWLSWGLILGVTVLKPELFLCYFTYWAQKWMSTSVTTAGQVLNFDVFLI